MSASMYVIAGEMSGDAHAAGLLEALLEMRPGLEIHGAGGPRMRRVAGGAIHDWLDQAAVMGVVEVLKHYSYFKRQFERMLAEIVALRPRVLLLVDYPGFNFRFADAVRKALPETRIIQYVCPQVWAWKKGRIPKMAQLFDELLCLLPFEAKIFEGTGLKATFVGHPLVDQLEKERVEVAREADLVALMPGSRQPEIAKLFPVMLEAAGRLHVEDRALRFQAPAATDRLHDLMSTMAAGRGLGDSLTISRGGAHELMQRACCGVIASGTATLEAGYYGLPYCLIYKLAWPTFLVAKTVVKIERIGLINILAGREVVEEFIQSDADAHHVGRALKRFLKDPAEAEAVRRDLLATAALLGGTGAHQRAAEAVAGWLD